MRVGRRTTVGLAIVLASLLSGAFAAAVASPQPTSNVTAYGDLALRLPADPGLAVGDRVRLVVTGFAPSAVVSVRVQSTSGTAQAHAGRDGALSYLFVVPNLPKGSYVLAVVGAPPLGRTPTGRTDAASPGVDVQNVIALVPRIGLFPFQVAQPGSGEHSGSTSSAGSGAGGLSDTGADIGGPLLLGVLLLVGGGAAIILGHRRRSRHDAAPENT